MACPPSSRRLGVRRRHQKKPLPRWGEGSCRRSATGASRRDSGFDVQDDLELGRRAHCGLAGIGPLEVCRLVPVQMMTVSWSSSQAWSDLPAKICTFALAQAFARALTPWWAAPLPYPAGLVRRCSTVQSCLSPLFSRLFSRRFPDEGGLIGEATRSNWFIGQAENLFDRAGLLTWVLIRVVGWPCCTAYGLTT